VKQEQEQEEEYELDGFVESTELKILDIGMIDESKDELHYRLSLMNLNPDVVISPTIKVEQGSNIKGDDEQTAIEEPLHKTVLRDTVPQTLGPMSPTLLLEERRDDHQSSCYNSSSCLSFSSKSSFRTSVWQLNVSSGEGLMEESHSEKKYYKDCL
jgi:hypothetical protein